MERKVLDDYFAGKDIGPEHLGKIFSYRSECIELALNPRVTLPNEGFTNRFNELMRRHEEKIKKSVWGRRVIELGPGANPLAGDFLRFGASEYVGVEPFHPDLTEKYLPKDSRNVSLVTEDGLTS